VAQLVQYATFLYRFHSLSCAVLCSNHSYRPRNQVSLYKILFHFKALLWESIILLMPPPTCKTYLIAILLQDHCAIYAPPPTLPFYAMHHTILVMAISCKGQEPGTGLFHPGGPHAHTLRILIRLVSTFVQRLW